MVDLKEEQQYEELRRLAQKLHIPIPEVFLELEVRDKDGRVIQRHRQRSHSWVRNAYNLMIMQGAGINGNESAVFGAGEVNIKLADGTVRQSPRAANICDADYDPEAVGFGYTAVAGWDTYGILVGSGTTAESFEDYFLDTQIVDGTGAGELSHIASETPSRSYADTTYSVDLVRYFNNNSGGNVDVNEVALVTNGYYGGAHIWMQSRDKLGATVTVPSTGQLKVTYTVELTYP
ncbi:hypothetical protein ES703_92134 [subsurface metagenome]